MCDGIMQRKSQLIVDILFFNINGE